MKDAKKIILSLLYCLLLQSWASSQPKPVISESTPTSVSTTVKQLEKDIPQLMKDADIPGFSAALISNGKLVWKKNFGVAVAETPTTPACVSSRLG